MLIFLVTELNGCIDNYFLTRLALVWGCFIFSHRCYTSDANINLLGCVGKTRYGLFYCLVIPVSAPYLISNSYCHLSFH